MTRKSGAASGVLTANRQHEDYEPSPPFNSTSRPPAIIASNPVASNGCPVLAYDKDPITGIVRHLDDQCIGCNYCVMKCPYEVPKYSPRLGIVRKCDMCANRLAVGEAPACAQACPSQAIKITLVDTAEIKERFNTAPLQIGDNPFLPDSPDPRVTIPTTQFFSKRGLPANLFAADNERPRLDHPHWPLAVMLLLVQAAAGMFLATAALMVCGISYALNPLRLAASAALAGGLAVSVLHLGQPLKAWRAFMGWRKSWLSREIILFNLFAAASFPIFVLAFVEQFHIQRFQSVATALQIFLTPLTALAVCVGVVGVAVSVMVYVDTKRPFWRARIVFGNFFGAMLLFGASFTAMMLASFGARDAIVRISVVIAVVFQIALLAWRRAEFHYTLWHLDSPIHFNARVIHELVPWTKRAFIAFFVVSLTVNVLAIANFLDAARVWTFLAVLAVSASEVIARHLFFVASASKRMPGGVPA